jgi:hypothetical protein
VTHTVALFISINILIISRCIEHTIYLATQAFIDKVKPQMPGNKRSTKNGTASVEDADDDNNDNMDDNNDDWVSDWIQLNDLPDDEEVDNVVDFTAGDVLGKTLRLINQVAYISSILFPLLTCHGIDLCLFSSQAVFCTMLQAQRHPDS